MRKFFPVFFVFIVLIFLTGTVFAKPEDVKLIPLSRYNYKNVDGYGFYDKCADFSWFGLVLNNETDSSYTVSLPKEVRITGWNGTVHPVANTRYKEMDFGSGNFLREDRKEIPFTGDLTLPAKSTRAVFMDIKNITQYNLYWDTNVFFKLQIKDGSAGAEKSISGVIAQRGNACPADQVCTAEIASGTYYASGGGKVTVNIKNNMPDAAEITGKNDVVVKWTDKSGKVQERTVENGVVWNTGPQWLGSKQNYTVTGVLSLPAEITAANRVLDLKFHFNHPSSLFFGDFYAQKVLNSSTGIQAVFSGNFDTNGKKGSFKAAIYNNENYPITLQLAASKDADPVAVPHAVVVSLPLEGKVSAPNGQSNAVTLDWYTGNGVTINAGNSADLEGALSFKNTSLIASNSTMVLTADLAVSDGSSSAAAGTVNRNADPNPVIEKISFCRDYKAGSNKLTFTYVLKNVSNIDILTELATTLAIPGRIPNPRIRYTECVSGGQSCMKRIDGVNITLKAGETANFSGEVTMDPVSQNAAITAETSLRYFPDGQKKVLYVGKTSDKCGSPVTPVPTKETPVVPTEEETKVTPDPSVTPSPSDKEDFTTESFCRVLKDNKKVVFKYELKNTAKSDIRIQLAKTLAVEGFESTVPIRYISCEGINGDSCNISGEDFTIKSGESVVFSGEADLPKAPASSNFLIRTSLIYYTKEGDVKAYFIGRTKTECSSVPDTPTVTPTADAVLKSEGFCRTFSSDGKKVSITYTLVNDSPISVSVQLAKTLTVDGQSRNLPISYSKCVSDGKDCFGRVKEYDVTLASGEKATFSGVVTLDNQISVQNFAAYTSLVYYSNSVRKVLNLGDTFTTCAAGKEVDILGDMEDMFAAEAVSEAIISNAYIESCGDDGNLHFTLKVTNSGTAEEKIDLSAVSFSANGVSVPAVVDTCSLMSAAGTDTDICQKELEYRIMTVDPNSTLNLGFISEQQFRDETLAVTAFIPDVSPDPLSFTASGNDSICGAVADTVSKNEDSAIIAAVSPAKDMMTLSIRFSNYSNDDSHVVPGTIYFDKDALEKYQGLVTVSPLIGKSAAESQSDFYNDREVVLPAHSSAVFVVRLNLNLTEAFDSTAAINWHFDVDGNAVNHLGAVDFAQKTVSSVEKALLQTGGSENSAGMIHFYSLGEPQLPKKLPATGFPTTGSRKVIEQPANLKYQELSGLHLEIPVIDAGMDLVRITLDENNEWAVQWLENQAGVLSAGSLPGHGTSMIAAHNHLDAENAGPFKMLQYLDVKDRIFVTDSKGSFLSYSVYANELLNPDDGELLCRKAIPGSLVLVTCENELPEGGYAFRRVVYAEPLQ